jgi:uroporphyrinogen III methyltransferase/synthase
VIQWGTTAAQRTVVGTLGTIAALVEREGITPPGVVVVGKVVALRDHLNWYERLPLFGKRIVVTRPPHSAGRLGELLEAEGAEVLYLPTIAIEPPPSWEPLDQAIEGIASFDWVAFTSANGVEQFFRRLVLQRKDARSLANAKVAAIGPETAESLRRHGIEPDLVPETFQGEGLVEDFRDRLRPGSKLLLPSALGAREVVADGLRRLGATVVVAPAYQSVPVTKGGDTLLSGLERERIHAVTFTSSSSVRHFMALLPDDGPRILKGVIIACIGPVTAETARTFGLEPAIVPMQSTVPALADAIIGHFCSEPKGHRLMK